MNKSITVAITRQIKPGSEEAFENAIRKFFAASVNTTGSLGAQLIKPLPGSSNNTYGILRSFASKGDRDAFYQSDPFLKWEQTVQPLVQSGYQRQELHGLEVFFSNPGLIQHPTRWKMAILTWIGVWPTVVLVSHFAAPYLTTLPDWAATGIVTLPVVLALAWAVMPVLTWVTRSWLQRVPEGP